MVGTESSTTGTTGLGGIQSSVQGGMQPNVIDYNHPLFLNPSDVSGAQIISFQLTVAGQSSEQCSQVKARTCDQEDFEVQMSMISQIGKAVFTQEQYNQILKMIHTSSTSTQETEAADAANVAVSDCQHEQHEVTQNDTSSSQRVQDQRKSTRERKTPVWMTDFVSLNIHKEVPYALSKYVSYGRFDQRVYIIYLGHKPHDDHELITDSHHDILSQVAGSKEEAKKMMMYSYRHGFSGFAAKLTNSQAKQIGELPDVVRVIKNPLYTTHTSRSWDFLGLSRNSPNNLLNKTNQGDGMIIGVLDSGISGESEAFNDNGMGPIPSRWKGICKSEANFNATIHCNKKIIGARWYIKGFMEEKGLSQSIIDKTYNLSAVDASGHGSHCASTAAGSYVNNLQYYGLNMGTIRGGAPLARLAIYKICWKEMMAVYCSGADILAGVDDAIKDGVDIISASIGDIFINIAEVNEESVLGIGSYHAVSHGISVIAAGGNSGPDSNTISNTAPWVITVAASNSDRHIVTPLTLGNNNTILGDGLFREQIFGPLITFHNITKGEQVKFIANEVKGKVLLVFFQQEDDILASLINLKTSGVLAIIVSIPPFDEITDYNQLFGIPIPNVYVDLEQGNQIYDYFQRSKSNNQDPMIKLGRSEILEGQEVVLKVPKFSSRGPNAFAPEILKPDIAAPGVNILAAVRPQKGDHGFQLMSGTSMAAPHVSGIVALLKVAHPDWSPAAIKSALVTTGN
ncbi:hypothetical protein KY290_006516 [Solanum tuberosum]|uniref:Uncharacterized protein n=1 Tax=Solanum tuberosum TaxID=4113 RepID=A0ABQ7WJ59_SOLTU|nr:hypothetical protein KY284_006540 [Solanum tuberosum]KAH0780089.1 hypothetical protein KY290_006516 [Solanum tuberosum]